MSFKVATIGFFDGVHRGHQYLCQQLKQLAATDGTTLVVTFNEHPQRVLGRPDAPELLTTNAEKKYFLECACGIDEVIFLDFTEEISTFSARKFMERFLRDTYGVTHLLIGYDHHFGRPQNDADGKRINEGFEEYRVYGRELGIEVVLAKELPSPEHISSSVIRQLIKEGDISHANRLLGYDFRVTGSITSGHQEGRKMGFPTANITPGDHTIIPAHGVYVTSAYVRGRYYPSVTNVGHRPTLDNGPELSVETHFLGVERIPELYGETLMLDFHQRLRNEKKFDDVETLKIQIARDIDEATAWHREHAQNLY